MGFEDEVQLLFLVPVNTKNECDGLFGNKMRWLSHTEAVIPSNIMEMVKESDLSKKCISGT